MKYGEIKDKLKSTKVELATKRKEVDSLTRELSRIGSERAEVDNLMNDEIKRMKKQALESKEQEISSPYEKKIGKIESKRNQLKANFDKKISSITLEEYSRDYEEELQATESVQDNVQTARELVENILGERFSKELFRQLEDQEVELDLEDIKDISNKLEVISKEVDRMNYKGKLDVFGKIDSILDKLNPCKEDDTSNEEYIRKQVIQYIAICGILSAVVVYFLSPYLIVAVFLLGGFNVYRSWRVYSLLLQCKLIEDNLNTIKQVIDDNVSKNMKKDRDKLQNKYNMQLDKIMELLNSQNDELQGKLLELRSNFLYDDSSIKAKYNINRQSIDDKEISLKSSIAKTNNDINGLLEVIRSLEDKLSKASETLKEFYISTEKIGKDYILDPQFLIDVKDNRPVFWEHPQTSCLFICDNEKQITNFARLISLQLVNRLDVFSIGIDFWDKRFMGVELQPFTTLPESMFSIAFQDDKITESLDILSEIIGKRVVMIKREFDDIKEYNAKMLELESLTESYRFVFIQNPDKKLLTNDKLVQLLVNGGPVGIYSNVFLTPEQMAELGNDGLSLVENTESFYVLTDEGIMPRAKEFVLDNYVNEK